MTKAYKTTTIKQDLMNRRTMMPMPTFTSRAKHQQPAHQMPEIPRSRIWRKTFSRGDGDCETRDRAGHALKHHKLRALKTKPWHHATTVIAQEFVIAPYHWKSSMGLRLQTYREQVVGVAHLQGREFDLQATQIMARLIEQMEEQDGHTLIVNPQVNQPS